MRSTYSPGSSWLHALPASTKLAGLAVLMLPIVIFRTPLVLTIFAGLTLLAYRTAGFSAQQIWQQVRPLRWMVVVLVGAHALLGGGTQASWTSGIVVAGTIVVAVALAGLVTMTTPVSAMIDAIARGLRPARRIGVNPERVALLLAITIRTIPVIAGLAEQVRDAQRARGVSTSVRAFAVPLVVRSFRHADALGEALIARGLDDPAPPS
jgi:biotin transport system permease protein